MSVRRRGFLKLGALMPPLGLSTACGGGGGTETVNAGTDPLNVGSGGTGTVVPPVVQTAGGTVTQPAVIAQVTGAYRTSQTYLFQSNAAPSYPSTLGGSSYFTDRWGASFRHIDSYSGWKWLNPGGDWLDANGVLQGTTPWATVSANAASAPQAVATYRDIDVTALLAHCQTNNKPLALRLTASQPRAICSAFSALGSHSIAVTYTNGATATLACRCVFLCSAGSTIPNSRDDVMFLPAFMEFDRPSAPVASAALSLTLSSHTSVASTVSIMLCSPVVPVIPVTGSDGLASRAGALDAGIASVSGVIGAQRYVDGSALTDFAVPGGVSINSEWIYDPALWGGAQDLNKLPHRANGVSAVGKWVNHDAATHLELVSSSHAQDGFEALQPGLGALKLTMEDDGFAYGAEVGSSGSRTGSNLKLMMPYEEMGLLDHIFVRYYLRIGTPFVRTLANRPEFRQGGKPVWSDLGGKFGIAPSHTTTYGGVSGSSGGGFGWQLRHSWAENESARGGPNESAFTVGWHLFDFGPNNPVGYRHGSLATYDQTWGQQSGEGGVLYAGRWYCVETEVKLNAVNPSDNSFTPDGLLRTWIDGKLAYERTAMVFRTLPIHQPAYSPSVIRPFRQLGIKDLWWNWYNGGTTPSTARRVNFVTGLVWARNRIGPMRA